MSTSDLFSLAGRIALITGGSRGLGREMALAFADAGADIVVASRKLEACEVVAKEIRDRGRRALAVACHVARWQEIDALVDAAYAEFGRIDVLVNNAGMSPVAPSSAATSEELFDKVIGVNFKGPFRLCATVGSRMAAGAGGSIINVSSSGTRVPHPRFGPYAGAKAALNVITEAFALEFGPTVRVNAISAGPFLTDVAKAWSEEKQHTARNAVGRPGRPEEIVTAALYLASSASSYSTASVVRVDGGIH